VALSKADLTEVQEEYESLKEQFQSRGVELHLLSAATRVGVKEIVGLLRAEVDKPETK
jgi:hypothetical protein